MSDTTQKKPVPGKSDAPAPKHQDKTAVREKSKPVKDREDDSQSIERAVYDGMQDLRSEKPK
jgi:hypothetical protein